MVKTTIKYHEYLKVNGLWSYRQTVKHVIPMKGFKHRLYIPASLATLNNNVTFC